MLRHVTAFAMAFTTHAMGLGHFLGALARQDEDRLVGIFLGAFFLGAEETGGVEPASRARPP